jgi:CDP-diacylglycerol--serine O-phosphatidyltransferase
MVWVLIDNGTSGEEERWYAFALTLFAGITMVSSVRFYSFKDINLRRSVPFIVIIALVLVFVFISSYPPGVLFVLFVGYSLSGYVMAAWTWWRRRRSG